MFRRQKTVGSTESWPTTQCLWSEHIVTITDFYDSRISVVHVEEFHSMPKVQGVTLGAAVRECKGNVSRLGDARVLEEQTLLMLKSSKMMAELG